MAQTSMFVSGATAVGVFALSVWFFVQGSKQWYSAIGVMVNASNCEILGCEASLAHAYVCTYGGNVTISFNQDDQRYVDQTAPNTDCDVDCCASIVQQQTPVYVQTTEQSHQIKFWSVSNDMNGVFTALGVAMLFSSVAFGCLAASMYRKT